MSGRKSLTFRLTLLFAAASTLVLLILGLLIGNSVERHFEEQDLGVLSGKMQLARHILGKTIAPEHLPRLFDRFYRADSSRQGAGDGVGLGLAITRSILRAHGGDAKVRSAHGLTAFELNIPT
ncbi:MAG: ATP-binding protein [Rhodocyclaceae bacterium]|nr:ATP-binding protein [Rhodocyclaceae bacterium]